MFFWYSLAFSMIQRILVIWPLVPLPFLNPAWTSESSQFTYFWSLGLEIFEHYFASMWDECSCAVLNFLWHWLLPGASTGDPTHDKVMRKRPDRQGRSGLKGLPGPARASTLKPKSVCLLFTIFCLSPTLLTLTGGYPRPPSSEENQLRALINKSPGLERSISVLTPLLAF